ncbi:hypothetical protein [Flavobacterium sp.]|uniref:hypothetical protein n=1 Tax=Flavobacterium sp. TaxID=239 RepID=UPI002486ED07|nr:hypothetical protein [Flavobacterium sp.]MDI1316264.1 hypothetical protein [Flavobacterium sp.]
MVGDIRNIIIIQSLNGNEKPTGKEIYEDLIAPYIKYRQVEKIKMNYAFHDIQTKNHFLEILKFYIVNAPYQVGGILIHFEMHGAENLTGLILADNSLVLWEEMVDLLREINIISKNNLYITMATCFGRMMYKGVDQRKKSPYSGYFSASKEVTVGEIMGDFRIIFEALLESGNFIKAHFRLEEEGSKKFFYMDSKRVFELNFEAFKNNPNYKKQVLQSAAKTVNSNGGDIDPEDYLSGKIYDISLKKVYQEQLNNFEF